MPEQVPSEERPVHYAETRYGFEYGALSIERMWSHNGYVCIRLVARPGGEYVDVQASPKGRKLHVTTGNERTG
jgi:hypothetical protein